MQYFFILLLLYESIISSLFNFSYIDEIITVLLIIFSLAKIFKENKIILTKNEFKIIILIFLIFIIGGISIIVFNIQNNMIISYFSGFLSLKSLISYICFRIAFYNSKLKYDNIMLKITEIGLYVIALLGIIDRIRPIYPRLSPRFGIYVTKLFFNTPTLLATFAISSLLICYFIINNSLTNKYRINLYIDIIASLFLVLITGRIKAIGTIILFFLIIFKEKIFKPKNKVKFTNFLIPLIVVVFFAYDYIKGYFFNDTQSRTIMLKTSIKIAKDYFPLGSGFGTFGTEISREYYSNLYNFYNISNSYGLTENYSAFITDSMFPSIIGETGFLGTLLYLLIFLNMFKNFNSIKVRKDTIFLYLILFYILIECVADSILMTSRGVFLFCFIAFVINYIYEKNGDVYENNSKNIKKT